MCGFVAGLKRGYKQVVAHSIFCLKILCRESGGTWASICACQLARERRTRMLSCLVS